MPSFDYAKEGKVSLVYFFFGAVLCFFPTGFVICYKILGFSCPNFGCIKCSLSPFKLDASSVSVTSEELLPVSLSLSKIGLLAPISALVV